MLNIDATTMADALDGAIDPNLKRLLDLRRSQLPGGGGTTMIVVQPDDAVATLEAAFGFAIDDDTPFEWVLDHAGWFEAPVMLTDEGDCVVLWVPDDPRIQPTLLALLRDQAMTPPVTIHDTTEVGAENR